MTNPRVLWPVALVAGAALVPFALSDYRVFQLTMVLVTAIAVAGLNLLTGFSGQISIGHGAFYALGAYTAAIAIARFGVWPWLTVPLAGLLAFGLGFAFGRPALRLRGVYLALATFALGVATPQLLREKHLSVWTGGVQGIVIDKPTVPFGLPLSVDREIYYVVLVVAIAAFLVARNLVAGRTGRAWVALRDHPVAALAMGIDTSWYKTLAFGVSAAYAGVAGALGAITVQFVSPDSFTLALSISLMVGSIVGGVTSIAGALYGAVFVQFVPLVAEDVSKAAPGAIFGALLVTTVFLMPRGIAGALASLPRPPFGRSPLVPAATVAVILALVTAAGGGPTNARPGVSATEIRLGQTCPYSGPASNLGVIGAASVAYFQMVNDRGGINGRSVRLISLDDAYSPPRTVEQTRKLVEREDVLATFSSVGTACQLSVHRYLNAKQVPQLFVTTGSSAWSDPVRFPWTMPSNLPYDTEGRAFARYILRERPSSRIAILYQNDDYGREYLHAVRDELGARADTFIVAERGYETTAQGLDSEMIALATSGADVFMNFTTGKFAALAIRKAYDSGWRPLQFISYNISSIGTVLAPAGLEKSIGIVTTNIQKTTMDPQWRDDRETHQFLAWMERYYPQGDPRDGYVVSAYWRAAVMAEVLRAAGDDLSREHVMRQAASMKDLRVPMLLPGIALNTAPKDYRPVEQYQFVRFDGESWVAFGPVGGR